MSEKRWEPVMRTMPVLAQVKDARPVMSDNGQHVPEAAKDAA